MNSILVTMSVRHKSHRMPCASRPVCFSQFATHHRSRDVSEVGKFDAWWYLYDQWTLLKSQKQIHGHTLRPRQSHCLPHESRREQSLLEEDELPYPAIRIHLTHRGAVAEYGLRGADRRSILRLFRRLSWSLHRNSEIHTKIIPSHRRESPSLQVR